MDQTLNTGSDIIYIRSAKCASASLKSALRSYSFCSYTFKRHHYTRYKVRIGNSVRFIYMILDGNVRYFERHFKEIFDSSWKFAFVRNPWDRAVSSYCYCRKYNELPADMSFKDYLRMDFKDMRPFVFIHSQPMYDILSNKDGCDYLDFTGRYENLQYDFDLACSKLGAPAKARLPHRHKVAHKKYIEYYDKESIALVAKKYKKDIEYFGYSFSV